MIDEEEHDDFEHVYISSFDWMIVWHLYVLR